ncbi:hypothetical protein EFK50_11515 [Nocardioides marmoriginsengisoli]|uniref:Uncharacterized protein n=1 Tax=Nocardioides marmoriginsengisoli TaxID=661483 RepID=A0A3N0CH92_9ACTN|nr:hypothetical protein EFK50_11515 [Nocardioides marmoriginsengisoli]
MDCNYTGAVTEPSGITNPISSLPTTLRTKNGTVQHDTGDSCKFQPGYYDDADALTSATDDCATSVFTPGLYYFDFHNDSTDKMANEFVMNDASPSTSGGSVWTISRTVIGGTLSSDSVVPGRCVSPLVSPSASGVQFVFGGTSRMYVPMNGSVELCGSYNGGAPPVVIYGLTSGDTNAPDEQLNLPMTAAATTGSNPTFTGNPNSASLLSSIATASDSNAATWEAGNSNSDVKLKLTGFDAAAIPDGSILQSATLKIVNRTTGLGTATYDLTVASDGAPDTTGTIPKNASYAPNTFDVTSTLSKAVHDGTLGSDPTVTIAKTKLKNVKLEIDKVSLDISYITPTLRGQIDDAVVAGKTNCVATPSSSSVPGADSCEFVSTKTNGNPKATFVIQGLTYAPKASFYLNLANNASSDGLIALKYGLVARSLNSSGWPNYTFADPVVSIPDSGPGFGSNVSIVDLKVSVCPSSATCSTGGTLALTVRVRITDPPITDPFNPPTLSGARKVDIMSWSEQR